MPKMYRSMFTDGDSPAVGSKSNQLGAREGSDIHPDSNGIIAPGEGMSMTGCPCHLPPHLIPRRLRSVFGKGEGRNELVIWCHGSGEYKSHSISEELYANATSFRHGHIEPATEMHKDKFNAALSETKFSWKVNEGHSDGCEMES